MVVGYTLNQKLTGKTHTKAAPFFLFFSYRPNDLILFELNKNSVVTVERLNEKLNSSYSKVHCHLQQLEMASKFGKSIMYDYTETSRKASVSIGIFQYPSETIPPFLEGFETAPEYILQEYKPTHRQWLREDQ